MRGWCVQGLVPRAGEAAQSPFRGPRGGKKRKEGREGGGRKERNESQVRREPAAPCSWAGARRFTNQRPVRGKEKREKRSAALARGVHHRSRGRHYGSLRYSQKKGRKERKEVSDRKMKEPHVHRVFLSVSPSAPPCFLLLPSFKREKEGKRKRGGEEMLTRLQGRASRFSTWRRRERKRGRREIARDPAALLERCAPLIEFSLRKREGKGGRRNGTGRPPSVHGIRDRESQCRTSALSIRHRERGGAKPGAWLEKSPAKWLRRLFYLSLHLLE